MRCLVEYFTIYFVAVVRFGWVRRDVPPSSALAYLKGVAFPPPLTSIQSTTERMRKYFKLSCVDCICGALLVSCLCSCTVCRFGLFKQMGVLVLYPDQLFSADRHVGRCSSRMTGSSAAFGVWFPRVWKHRGRHLVCQCSFFFSGSDSRSQILRYLSDSIK